MSQWTHVNGNIRFDYFPIEDEVDIAKFTKEVTKVLGEVKNYDHVGLFGEDLDNCPESLIPCGSEGSIEYDIHKTPRGYDVGVWGDLRDFGEKEVPEIIEWFGKIMIYQFLIPFFVRDALLEIEVEFGKTYILRDWSDNELKYKVDEV